MEGDRGSGRFDDLFEDLDRFFAQGEEAETHDEDREEGREAAVPGGQVEDREAPATTGSGAAEEEFLPTGWLSDVEDIDRGPQVPGAEPPGVDGVEGDDAPATMAALEPPEEDTPDARLEPQGEPPPRPEPKLHDTAEMAANDWTRLREALAEQAEPRDEDAGRQPKEDEEAGGFALEPQPAGQPAGEESGELSVEDLRKAPPEYRDLPTAEPEGGTLVEEEGDMVDHGSRAGPHDEDPDDLLWEEPAISDVERAADRLAGEFDAPPGPEDDDLEAELGRRGPRTVKVGEPETLMGPSWEEPGSRAVGLEPSPPPGSGGRNVPAALLTAVVLAAAALISLAIDKAAFAVVAGVVVMLGQAELYATMHRRGHQPATALGLVVGGLILAAAYFRGEPGMLLFVAVALVATLLWYMAVPPKSREGALANAGVTLLGIVYVPFLAAYFLLLLGQENSGRALMLSVLGLTLLYDAAAFFFGSFWGQRALAPTISPKKSWEGLFGATVVTFAVAIAVLPEIAPFEPSVARAIGMALVVSIFAPLGDLAESMIKRDLGVKDMGSFLPGHGGALDRIDSALFVGVASFYFVRVFLSA